MNCPQAMSARCPLYPPKADNPLRNNLNGGMSAIGTLGLSFPGSFLLLADEVIE